MMKKGFSFLLAIMMIITLFAGCGASVLLEEAADPASSVYDAAAQSHAGLMPLDGELPLTIAITFEGNGGTPEYQEILADLQADDTYVLRSQPEEPTREHHVFAGWFTARVGGVELSDVEFSFSYDSPRVFYARWRSHSPVFPMLFDANGGFPALQPVVTNAGSDVTFGNLLTDPRVVVPMHPDGYEFLGWSRTADNDPADIILATALWTEAEVTANPMVFAVWDISYDVGPGRMPMNFRGNGGIPNNQEVVAWISQWTTFGNMSTDPTVVRPERDGYEFLGWSASEDGSTGIIPANTPWTPDSPRTVWAQWGGSFWDSGFGMNFRGNGGTPADQPRSVWIGGYGNNPIDISFGNLINGFVNPEVTAPTREGYRFLGWSNTEDGSSGIIASSTHWDQFSQWIPSHPVAWTVWAQWEVDRPIQLTRASLFEFQPQAVGAEPSSLMTTVRNTAATWSDPLMVRLTGANASNFEFTHLQCPIPQMHRPLRDIWTGIGTSFVIPNIEPGGSTEFRLRTVPGLPAGTHTATVTVVGRGVSESFDLVIEVR